MPDDSDLATPLLNNDSLDEGSTPHSQKVDTNPSAKEVRDEARRVLDAASFAEKETHKSLGTPPPSGRKKRTDRSLSLEGRTLGHYPGFNYSVVKNAAMSLSNKGLKLYDRLKDKLNRTDDEDVHRDEVSFSV